VALSIRHLGVLIRLGAAPDGGGRFLRSSAPGLVGGAAPFTAGFWLAHLFDIVGVLGLAIGAPDRPSRDRATSGRNEPLSAFEPVSSRWHRFVAMLETRT
jgi:hypothetical protein